MKKLSRSTTSRALTATFLSFTFLPSPQMMISPARSAQEPLKLRSASQLRTEASLYDTAIREIGRVATMKLETIDDIKAANSIIKQHVRNLRYSRPRLAVMGFGDSTFVGAVRERTRDSKSTEAFALELAKDPNAILKLSGASFLKDRIVRSVETDIALLKKVAERLKKASDDIKAKIKPHHAPPTKSEVWSSGLRGVRSWSGDNAASIPASTLEISTKGVISVLIVVALVMNPGLLVNLPGLALAGTAIANMIENFGTEEGRDRIAKCLDSQDEEYTSCVERGRGLCCGLDILWEASCVADLILGNAFCLVQE